MKKPVNNWIIVGTNQEDKAFRPSDWAGRIVNSTLRYSKVESLNILKTFAQFAITDMLLFMWTPT